MPTQSGRRRIASKYAVVFTAQRYQNAARCSKLSPGARPEALRYMARDAHDSVELARRPRAASRRLTALDLEGYRIAPRAFTRWNGDVYSPLECDSRIRLHAMLGRIGPITSLLWRSLP